MTRDFFLPYDRCLICQAPLAGTLIQTEARYGRDPVYRPPNWTFTCTNTECRAPVACPSCGAPVNAGPADDVDHFTGEVWYTCSLSCGWATSEHDPPWWGQP